MQLIHYPDLKFLSMRDPEKGQNCTGILAQLLHNKTLCGALTRWGYTSHTNTHITKRKSRIRAQKV
jgi:hypothetical protein